MLAALAGSRSSSAHGWVRTSPRNRERGVDGDGCGGIEIVVVGRPANAGRKFGQLDGSHEYASRCRGLSHRARSSGLAPGEVAGVCGARSSANRRCTSCSSANWRMVSNIEKRVRSDDGRRPERLAHQRIEQVQCRQVRHQIRPPRTLRPGRIRRRTPNTMSTGPFRRRRADRRTTAPRLAASGGVPGRAATDQQPEPVVETIATQSTVIDSMREAANSIASGIPSRRRQISTTASASSAGNVMPARTA